MEIFKAAIEFHDFQSGDILRPHDDVLLRTAPLDHPDGTNGYRLEYGGRRLSLCSATRKGFPESATMKLVVARPSRRSRGL